MFIWIQLNNFPNSNLMTSIIFAHRTGNAYTVKILNFIRSSCPEIFRPATLLKKKLWHRCFPVNFVKFLKTLFLTEPLWWLLLFCGDHYADCLQIFQNISEIVKFEKALNSGKLDWQNLLKKFLHISKFNFAIVFSSKIFKSCNVFGLTCFLH